MRPEVPGVLSKLNIMDLIFLLYAIDYWDLQTWKWAGSCGTLGGDKINTQAPGAPPTTGLSVNVETQTRIHSYFANELK